MKIGKNWKKLIDKLDFEGMARAYEKEQIRWNTENWESFVAGIEERLKQKRWDAARDYLSFVMDKNDKETFDVLSKEFGLEVKDGDWIGIMVVPPDKVKDG